MIAADVASRLEGVKPSGENAFMARCPAHDDGTASLSVKDGEKGVLLRCHAGCSTEAVVAAMGLRMSDLFKAPQVNGEAKPHAKPGPKGPPTYVYPYTDPEGVLLYEVCRWEDEDGRKSIMQRRPDGEGHYVWGLSEGFYVQKQNGDWVAAKPGQDKERRHFPKQEPVLYNWPAVAQTCAAGKTVVVLEGEKKVEALRALGITATCNTGGAGKWKRHYGELLRGAKSVFVIPDNDKPGEDHARQVFASLFNERRRIVALPGLQPKGDIYDWLMAGHTKEELWNLCKAAMAVNPEPEPAPEQDNAPPAEQEPEFRILGHNRGRYFFLPRRTKQILSLSSSAFRSKTSFLELAPLRWWQSRGGGDGAVNWTQLADSLIDQCMAHGVFDPTQIRGRGAWLDEGRLVIHQGDSLVVDGAATDLLKIDSRFTYEHGRPLHIPQDSALAWEEARRFLDLCRSVRWERALSARLFAGWCAVAPICGVLPWRPHIWITGQAGAGKSWVTDAIARPVLAGTALFVQSATTEAGLRQQIKLDARPVLFDEAGDEEARGHGTIQRVLELARQASSEGGAQIVKGTVGGESVHFRVQSAFLFSSIAVALRRRSDETRVSILGLRAPNLATDGERNKARREFEELDRLRADLLTEAFCRGFVARSCRLAKVIRANAFTFSAACARILGSQRLGDQIGAMLAGSWSLESDEAATPEEAEAFVRGNPDLREFAPAEDTTDENRCLGHILEHRVRVELPAGKPVVERTIGELLESAADGRGDVHPSVASEVLSRHGIRLEVSRGVLLSNNHSAVADILAGTPWATGWSHFLKRLPGAQAAGAVRFAGGLVHRSTLVPWKVVSGSASTEESGVSDAPF